MEITLINNIRYKFYRSFKFILLILFGLLLVISSIAGWFWMIRFCEVMIFTICMITFFKLKKEPTKIIINSSKMQLCYNNKDSKILEINSIDVYSNLIILFSINESLILHKKQWSNTKNLEDVLTANAAIKSTRYNTKKKTDYGFIIDIIDEIIN